MALSENEQILAVQTFSAAAFDSQAWQPALRLLAKAGGGWAGQLVGIDGQKRLQFNLVPEMPPEIIREFELRGGDDPQVNPRARMFGGPAYLVCSDEDVAKEGELGSSEFVQDLLYKKADSHDFCMAKLANVGETQVMAGVCRSKRQGRPDRADRQAFGALLPHIHSSIQLQARLDEGASLIAVGALEALSYAAFIVDRAHRVVALTREAERMLVRGKFLTNRNRSLEALSPKTNELLQNALRLACLKPGSTRRSQINSVIFRDEGGRTFVADVAPLPASPQNMRFGPVAVVAFGQRRPFGNASRLLQESFDLTAAEAAVTMMLLKGISTSEIARNRSVTVETVRKQIKTVFQKVGVDSKTSLMNVLATFIPSGQY